MFNEAVQALIENIRKMVVQMLKNADYDRTYTGRVKDVKQVRNGLYIYIYTITINGTDYSIKSKLQYKVDDYVLVLVPRNDWGNAKILATGEELNGSSGSNDIAELETRVTKLENKKALEYTVLSVRGDE